MRLWLYKAVSSMASVPATAQAATITVDSTADNNLPDHCTLREAINSALGALGETGNCATTSDTTNQIVFKGSLTGTIELTNGRLPEITGGVLTITGPATTPGITIDGDNNPVMSVDSGATLNLANLTITNGSSDDGAIYNDGTLTVTNSTFSDNNANLGGGGIYNDSQATLVVTNSTFFGNRADVNGGMGGGIFNRGPLTVTNSTFADNSATAGGGIDNEGAAGLKSTILAGESKGAIAAARSPWPTLVTTSTTTARAISPAALPPTAKSRLTPTVCRTTAAPTEPSRCSPIAWRSTPFRKLIAPIQRVR